MLNFAATFWIQLPFMEATQYQFYKQKQNSCSEIQWLTIQDDDKQVNQTGKLKNSADSTCALVKWLGMNENCKLCGL